MAWRSEGSERRRISVAWRRIRNSGVWRRLNGRSGIGDKPCWRQAYYQHRGVGGKRREQ